MTLEENRTDVTDELTDAEQPQPLEVVSSDTALANATSDEDVEAQLALKNLEKRRAQKKRRRRIKIIAGCAVAAVVLAATVGRSLLTPPEPEEAYVPETAVVERRDFENVISSSGALRAGSTVVVTPEVDGIIESVSVSEGQAVQKGDLLFTIKNDSLDRAVRDAAQDVQTADQGVASAQREVSNARSAREEAWSKYNKAWSEADAAHREWAYLKANYEKLHSQWESRKKAAERLACGAPQNPGDEPGVMAEPVEPTQPSYDPSDDDETRRQNDEDYRKALEDYKRDLKDYETQRAAHDRWQELYNQFLADTEAYKAYQDALALVGDEPQPAGVEPEYPESPDDTMLMSAIQSAQEGVTTASQAVQKAQEAYDDAVKTADKRRVTAPSAGNVVALGAKVGEPVGGATSGSSDGASSGPLVQISDVNQMSVNIEVNEIDILNVKKGQNAKVTFSAVSGVEVDAQVAEVATVATGSGDGGGIVTFHVGLIIPKPDAKLREGMTANVKIYTVDIKNALVVPTSALFEGSDGMTVEVVVDEETMETESRAVKVGARNSTEAVIEDGLEEGETVLLTGGLMDDFDMGYAG